MILCAFHFDNFDYREDFFQTGKSFFFISDPLKTYESFERHTHGAPFYCKQTTLNKIVLRACIREKILCCDQWPWPICIIFCHCCNLVFICCIVNYCLHFMKSLIKKSELFRTVKTKKVNAYYFFNSSSKSDTRKRYNEWHFHQIYWFFNNIEYTPFSTILLSIF